jgi:leucyl-tRNA synthetase
MSFDHQKIESKWQKVWEKQKTFRVENDDPRPKFYCLIEFPYPSGAGLHVGHPRSYTALDVLSRKRRMQGFNVLYPIGWDAFGLPTENYAIKTGRKPQEVTVENIDTFRRQLKSLGIGFDWSREVNTTDPAYYKWTQWMFLEFFKAGLAYKAKTEINWCPSCKIGLANEEAVGGNCERCGGPVQKRQKEQWMIAITKYADRLLSDLDTVDYLPKIKKQQQDWIGRSEGVEIDFSLKGIAGQGDGKHTVRVFTTRPDTIDGATFVVISPELAKSWIDVGWQASEAVKTYVAQAMKREEEDRLKDEKEKTGVDAGISAVNPYNGNAIPVWIADYVIGNYGTGAIMGVPQHDERDHAFATTHQLPIEDRPLLSVDDVVKKTGGTKTVRYKLRDWVFSRQRYWGEPIPLMHCDKDGWVPVPEKDLPVELPDVDQYQPSDEGESPLADIEEWVNVTCPTCKGPARRETDTMPNWAGSSWYFLRYTDPKNKKAFASKEALNQWMPVDWYNGGMEHTTLHLLYSRFWNKFLFDRGHVPTSEPYAKRTSHGLVLAEDGSKMSKSKGNVVNPDEIVSQYGADALRAYILFMGPFSEPVPWSTNGLIGVRRFLERVNRLSEIISDKESEAVTRSLHKTIKKVGDDIEGLRFNTAVSAMMSFVNDVVEAGAITEETLLTFLTVLGLFSPHLCNEIRERVGGKGLVEEQTWPAFDASLTQDETVKVAIQVNGKLRGTIDVAADADEQTVRQLALAEANVAKYVESREIKKTVFVPGKLISFVV